MSQQILDIYTVDSLQISESVFHSADTSWLTQNHQSAFPISPIDSDMTDVQAQSYWRPSDALRRTLRKLYEKDCAISLHPLFLLFTFIISTLCKMGN